MNIAEEPCKYENFTGRIDWFHTICDVKDSFFELRDTKFSESEMNSLHIVFYGGELLRGFFDRVYCHDLICHGGVVTDCYLLNVICYGTEVRSSHIEYGILRNSDCESVRFSNGIFDGGTFCCGVFENGTFKSGTFYNGVWFDGIWESGRWSGGRDKRGVLHRDSPDNWS